MLPKNQLWCEYNKVRDPIPPEVLLYQESNILSLFVIKQYPVLFYNKCLQKIPNLPFSTDIIWVAVDTPYVSLVQLLDYPGKMELLAVP